MNQSEVIVRMQLLFDDIFIESPRLTPALTPGEVPEWDSMMHISLLLALENEFGISFQTGEVAGSKTVGEIAELIARKKIET